MSFDDRNLTCRDCGNQFTFTAGEQEFYAQKGFTNEPTRCPSCRQARKAQSGGGSRSSYGERSGGGGGGYSSRGSSGGGGGYGGRSERGGGGGGDRQSFPATCAECGRSTTVPFQPTQG